ncbi:hypothetical protein DFH09DRAFT_1053812 [Mycena vulgaris]|nr:hypothetical protein DFH09DRAFT_1053812 [Mycena vulgaris]
MPRSLDRPRTTLLGLHDMRSIPQPTDDPHVDGCPIIRLSDSIQDLEHLLRALYNPFFDSAEQLEFPVVAALVRLGKKYDFHQFLAAAVARLTVHFPCTVEKSVARSFTLDGDRLVDDPGLLFDAINLATENGLHALLPSLYLDALLEFDQENRMDYILTGIARNDNSIAKLSFENQVILIRSRHEVHRIQANLLFVWMKPQHLPSAACSSIPECSASRDQLTHEIFIPVYTLRAMIRWASYWERALCTGCRKASKTSFSQGSHKFWTLLPTFFGLPNWADLKNDI